MADSRSTQPPSSEDLHWGIGLRLDVQEIRQDIRDLRNEASEFRKEVAQQFADHRQEAAQQIREVRQDVRHSMMAMLGFNGVLAAIIVAFIQHRLGAG